MVDRLDILRGLRRYAFHAPNHVVAEVKYEEQRRRLQAAIAEGELTELDITDPTETALYVELRQFLLELYVRKVKKRKTRDIQSRN